MQRSDIKRLIAAFPDMVWLAAISICFCGSHICYFPTREGGKSGRAGAQLIMLKGQTHNVSAKVLAPELEKFFLAEELETAGIP